MNTRERMIKSFLGNIEGWKSVLDSSTDFITLLDNEFNVVWANNAMKKVLNTSSDSCTCLKCFEAVHGTQSPIPNCPHSKMILDGQEYTEEVTEDKLGGCFLVTASPIKDESENVIGSIHIARNISERKKAAENIQRLADVVESSDDAIITKSLEGTIISWNKGAKYIYGYSAEEVLGKPISILEPPEFSRETEKLINKIKNGKKIDHYETLRLKKDGNLINVSITLSPVFDTSGDLVAISTIARDITEHKLAEKQKQKLLEEVQQFNEELEVSNEELQATTEELQVSNEELRNTTEELQITNEELKDTTEELQAANEKIQRFADIIESSDDAVITKSLEGTIIGWNKGAEYIYGYSAREIFGKPISILEPSKLGHETEILMDKIKSGERIDHYETLRLRKDGTLINVSVTLSPVFDTSGKLVAISAISRDTTKRKKVERQNQKLLGDVQQFAEELEVSNEELQATTEELQVSNEELQNTTKELQEANEELQVTTEELQVANEELRQQSEDLTYLNQGLRESEQRMNRSQEIGHIGSWELDLVNNNLFWSDEVYRIFGMQPQEFGATYDAFIEAIHPDDREVVDDAYSGSINEGRDTYEIEHRVVRKSNGEVRIVHEKCEHIKDESGQIIKSVGLVHDITERKKAEEALQTTLQRFYTILSSMRAGILLVTDDDFVEFVNPAFCDYFDLVEQPEGIIGLTASEMIKKIKNAYQYPDGEVSHIREIVDCWQPVIGEEVFMQDGRTCLRNFIPISIQGKPYGRLWVHNDITERKKAENAILWNQKRNELLAEVSSRLLSSENPQDIIDDICQKTMELLECDVFFNYLVDEGKGSLHLNAYAGIPEGEARNIEWLDYGVAVCGCAALESRRIIAENIMETSDPKTDMVKSYGVQAYACHPLMVEGLSIGTLSFGTNSRTKFADEELELMKAVADQISIAMNRLISNRILKESEETAVRVRNEWEQTFEAVPDLIAILDTDYKVVRANKAMADKFGVTPEECVGLACYNVVHGMDEPPSFCPHQQLLEDGYEHTEEVHEDRLGGDFLVSASPLHDSEGKLVGSVHVARDINKRKREEKELYQLNRAYRALSNSSQAMIRTKNELEYLEEVCRIIIEDCSHSMVWIGYAEEDEDKTVRSVAYSGFEEGYLETLNITWADTERGRGPTGTAIRTGKPSICKNMLTDPEFEPWREEAVKRGYASSLAIPLMWNENVFGALTIYSKEPDPFSKEEIKLLTELAEDLAYGINAIKLRIALEQSESALREAKDNLENQVKERTAELEEAYKDLKKNEEQLKRQAELLDLTQEAIIVRDMDGNILLWNDGAVKTYGWSIEEAKGKITHLLLHTEFPTSLEDLNNKLISKGQWDGELIHTKSDGTKITVLSRQVLKKDENENPISILEINSDISERKKMEEELKFAGKYNRNLIETSLDPLVTIGPDGKITDVNGATESVTGYSRDGLIGTDFSDYFTQPENAREGYKQVFRDGWVIDYPLEIKHKNGHVTPVLYNASVYEDESGDVIGVFAAARDITELKRAEVEKQKLLEQAQHFAEELEVSNEELQITTEELQAANNELKFASKYNRSLIEASLDPLVTIGSDGKITDVNWATELATGYYRDEIIGTDFSDYFTEPERARKGYQEVFRKGWVFDYPLEIKNKDGHITPVLYNASVYRDDSGDVSGVFAAARDITERKKAEKLLKLKIEELARSNAELEQFAYVSSHDLQEPLRMIGSYLQLLQRRYQGQLDDKADTYINFAVDGASRMQNLINDLLEFSRVTTQAREFEPTDCEFILNQVLSNLEVSIKENDAVISHDHLPTVIADSTQLVQVFQNLIINAIKFRSEKAPKIYISAKKEDDQWIFSVADNGIGIDSKHSERIFEVFKRLHKRREYPGTGIGLSICKKIIERHGGHIWVKSESDKGSVFYFTLPGEGVINGKSDDS
jgi:PAS domain S-box-containing protein